MKHSIKITLILLSMFLLAQAIGLGVNYIYFPYIATETVTLSNNETITVNVTTYKNLPEPFQPAEDNNYQGNFISLIIAFILAIGIMLLMMKFKAEVLLRIWFFIVIILGLTVALNAFLISFPYALLYSFILSIILAYLKVFRRNIIIHNLTELLIYPGISAVFVPLLNLWGIVALLVVISFYDMYAVWHSGFMQRMAKYQMKKVKVFSGFFIPYIRKEDRALIDKIKKGKAKNQKIKVNIALLGGGDIIFPMILSGIVMQTWGLIPALIVTLGATLALAYLFCISEKGKFYPAMPFITSGCLIGLAISSLLS
jgi:presenilin-like A22 family membrane protease